MAAYHQNWAIKGVFRQKIRPILSSDWSNLEKEEEIDIKILIFMRWKMAASYKNGAVHQIGHVPVFGLGRR